MLTIEEIKKRINVVHRGRVALDISTYVKTTIKARFIDSEYGEWWAKPNDIFNGHGHPKKAIYKRNDKHPGSELWDKNKFKHLGII